MISHYSRKKEEYSPNTNHSSISFSSKLYSPKNPPSPYPSRARQYKSPNSTPTSSPMPFKIVSSEDFSLCLSDQKTSASIEKISFLKKKIQKQDQKIQILEQENKRLSQLKISENWEKELSKRNEDLRKLEHQLNYYKELSAERRETDQLLDEIASKVNKIQELEIQYKEMNQKCTEYEKLIISLKEDNFNLSEKAKAHESCITKAELESLINQIENLENDMKIQAKESNDLKEENNKLKSGPSIGTILYFYQDISKIKREIKKLAKVLDDVHKGNEISLKFLLAADFEACSDPVQQLTSDIYSIKSDLNKVLDLISDIHADQCANIVCNTQ